MTLIIAYPHSDRACLLNSTVGVVFSTPPNLPNIVPAKKIEVLLVFVSCSRYYLQPSPPFQLQYLQTKVSRNHPSSPNFPPYQGSNIVTRSLLRGCHMFRFVGRGAKSEP